MKSPVSYLTDTQYTALPLEQRYLHVMRSIVGSEEDWGPNRSALIDKIESLWGLKGQPYCAMAVGWALVQAGADFGKMPKGWPSTAALYAWAKQTGRLSDTPARGKIFVYVKSNGKGHAGVVTGVLKSGKFRSIEANTDAAGSREGDGVWEKVRSVAFLRQYPKWGFIDVSDLV